MAEREPPLFARAELDTARRRLQDAGYPLTGHAAELRELGTPEPFDTYTLAASESLRALQQPTDPRRLTKAARRAADVVDRVAKWVGESVPTAKGRPLKLACKAGCFYCCSIRVNVLSAEAASILEHIEARFSAEEKARTKDKIDAFVAQATPLDPRTRFLKPALCPLNHDGLCTVYDVRPMACRSHHSFSVQQCQTSYENWRQDLPVTRSAMRKACSGAAVIALADVLAFVETDARALELPEALQSGWDEPKITERVLIGEGVFDSAFLPEVSEAADAPDLFDRQL